DGRGRQELRPTPFCRGRSPSQCHTPCGAEQQTTTLVHRPADHTPQWLRQIPQRPPPRGNTVWLGQVQPASQTDHATWSGSGRRPSQAGIYRLQLGAHGCTGAGMSAVGQTIAPGIRGFSEKSPEFGQKITRLLTSGVYPQVPAIDL